MSQTEKIERGGLGGLGGERCAPPVPCARRRAAARTAARTLSMKMSGAMSSDVMAAVCGADPGRASQYYQSYK